MKSMLKKIAVLPLIAALVFSASCADKTELAQQQDNGVYPQEFAPKYLDVLWVIDNRSPLDIIKAKLITSATEFFKRLANNSEGLSYRMAFTSMDMAYNRGALIPANYVLTGNSGNVNERASLFANFTGQIINLKTGAEARGFEAAKSTLSGYFKSEKNIPLAIVFVSDGDDKSANIGTGNLVDNYTAYFKSLKDSADLVRVYSVNYVALSAGESTNDASVAAAKRCATRYNADADQSWFEDRFFALATAMGGKTANICGNTWRNEIDLSGLQLKQLQTRFKLDKQPRAETLRVRIVKNGAEQPVPRWVYDEATNEIVFDTPPPGGAVIQVTFLPR